MLWAQNIPVIRGFGMITYREMKKEDIQALCNNLEDALYGRTYIGILSK